jgi:hypothetical protein
MIVPEYRILDAQHRQRTDMESVGTICVTDAIGDMAAASTGLIIFPDCR